MTAAPGRQPPHLREDRRTGTELGLVITLGAGKPFSRTQSARLLGFSLCLHGPRTSLGHQTWVVACHGPPGAIFKGQEEALSSLVTCEKH